MSEKISKKSIKPFAEMIKVKNEDIRRIIDDCSDLKQRFLKEINAVKLIKDGDLNAIIHLIDNADKYDFGHLVDKMDEDNKVFRKPLSDIIEVLDIPEEIEGKEFLLGLLRIILLQTTFSKEWEADKKNQ
jgi:hypothetical protein